MDIYGEETVIACCSPFKIDAPLGRGGVVWRVDAA